MFKSIFGNTDDCLVKEGLYNRKLVRKTLNTFHAPKYYNNYDPECYDSPPKNLENLIGISGISNDWKMPYGLTHMQLENILMCAYNLLSKSNIKDEYDKIYFDLLDLNPELNEIAKNTSDTWSILLGATSCFNPEDIRYYVYDINPTDDKFISVGEENDSYKSKQIELYELLHVKGIRNYHLGWRVSEKTIDYILEKLKN